MLIQGSPERRLFELFAPGVAYVAVEDASGRPSIGTCFHIGDQIFVTARHVVDKQKVVKVATTVGSFGPSYGSFLPNHATQIEGPFFHPNDDYDLAALRIPRLHAPQIPFLPFPEAQSPDALVLRTVIVMGFPPIPGSKSPVLLCARAEVNASFVNYFDNQRVWIVSCLGRGGCSGGPALTAPQNCLGIVTRVMVKEAQPEELGFTAVVGPWPILELLHHHSIMPPYLRQEMWNSPLRLKPS
jgi:S1-C subfamily serine protease